MSPRRTLALPLLAVLAGVAPAAGQALEGRAVERETLQPVAGAVIVLRDSAGSEVAAAQTDSAGAFRLAAPAAGAFSLSTRRVGYPPPSPAPCRWPPARRCRWRCG